MVAPLIAQLDIEQRIGAARLVQLLDDNRDGVADAALVTGVIQEASDRAAGKLLKAFSVAQIVALAAADQAVRGAIVDIACGLAGQHKPELVDAQGKTLYDGARRDALATLEDFSRARDRIAAEETVGNNRTMGNRVSTTLPPATVFAATKANPKGPGGF